VGNPKAEGRGLKEGRSPKGEGRGESAEAGITEEPTSNTAASSLVPRHPSPAPRHSSPVFIRLWFADNGIGIPAEAQERIFRMFQRLDRSYDGTGVGLTVVRKAVEKMGGSVGLESELGKGSRFWVELRAAEEAR
jgi:signal transduction histidine kinase